MSQVSVSIGGRSYTLACDPGQEAQVTKLGAIIDQKLGQLGGNLSPSPAQNLLFAALLLADELQEAKSVGDETAPADQAKLERALRKIEELKLELDVARTEHEEALRENLALKQAADAQPEAQDDSAMAHQLELLAAGLESCATMLEEKLVAP
ncbi:cell division protein ZapA [Altererythrobacter sp.]|uniref:cell division protein ZapA n=1 Tax=Altererythrobacter sp. TaxID=1872480 RepID=UPI003CFBE2EE